MTTTSVQIGFKTDKAGKQIAYSWNRNRVIWVRIPLAEAQSLISSGGATEVRYHHFGPNG